jgi:CBS domain-containing protein
MVFPVLDNNSYLIGEVNQREILKLALPKKYLKEEEIMGPSGIRKAMEHYAKKVEDIMDKNNIQISPDTKISQICKVMVETGVGTVEVIGEGEQPKGIVSELDILRYVKDIILK